MRRFRHIAILACLVLFPYMEMVSHAQQLDSAILRYNSYTAWRSREKVYLHYDRSCYTAGETIWFKGWVKESSAFSNLDPSKFLYVEVLDDVGNSMSKVKILRRKGAFPGCLELPDNLETGDYTIRAYTLWQLNAPEEYLFNDRIRIIGEKGKRGKTLPPPATDLTIAFYPEGGRYFAGQNSVIGFKVTDQMGRSVDFNGTLVNDMDDTRKPVLAVHDGMGAFSFRPVRGCNYKVLDQLGRSYPLPAPSEDGATIQLRIRSGRYYVSAIGFGGGNASLLVRDLSGLRPLADISLDGKMGTFMMEHSFFRPGINHFLLVDSSGKILAERLFYVRDEDAPVCNLTMQEFDPSPRTYANGVITLKGPDGAPLDGSCSISVVRGVLKDWQPTDGITSYFGLSSELRGKINDPYYYFDPDISEHERNPALDLLMMIQGWRYYDIEKLLDVNQTMPGPKYQRERQQIIRGRISRRRSSKIPEKFTFTFMIPKGGVLQSLRVDRGRYFIIDSLDFQENTEMIINIGRPLLAAQYLPKLDPEPSARPHSYKSAPGQAKEAPVASPVLSDLSADTLRAAMVTANYEYEDVLTYGRSYREDLVTYKDFTLIEYLRMTKSMFEYDGENMYNINMRKISLPSVESSDDSSESSADTPDFEDESGKVKLIVDDNEQAWWSFDMLRLEDLRSLSITTHPDPIHGGEGGVVQITVKPGGLQRNADRNPSLLYFVPLGYQVPRYFDSPRYDRGDIVSRDVRNTIFWSPDVILRGGRATIEFCNTDRTEFPYIVRIEGLTSDGRPFSRHCEIRP